MKRNFGRLFILAITTAFFMAGIQDLSAQTRKPTIKSRSTARKTTPAPRQYSIAVGTRLRVRMNDNLSSKTAKVGDRFTVTVTEPVYSSTGVLLVPTGSTITGRVDAVQPAQKKGRPGTIDASFISIRTPNGTRRAINGTLTDLTSDDAKSDSEGTASGDRMKHRKIVFIGGGGAGGAIIGAAVGGGKGALIGAIVGAGAGFLGERLTKGEEAEVRSGTEFGVQLNQPVYLPKFVELQG